MAFLSASVHIEESDLAAMRVEQVKETKRYIVLMDGGATVCFPSAHVARRWCDAVKTAMEGK